MTSYIICIEKKWSVPLRTGIHAHVRNHSIVF